MKLLLSKSRKMAGRPTQFVVLLTAVLLLLATLIPMSGIAPGTAAFAAASRGVGVLAANEPISVSFGVSVAKDAGVTNGVRYGITNAAVGGTDASSNPLFCGSVSVTIPDGLSLSAAFGTNGVSLPADWAATVSASGNSVSYIITNQSTSGTRTKVETFLNSLYFTLTTANTFPANNSKIAIDVNGGSLSVWVDGSGKTHYYEFVPSDGISWGDAYNAARVSTYNGMQGYLATITSQAEQDFIYDSIAKKPGWLGGTRALKPPGNTRILDDATVDTAVTGINADNLNVNPLEADKWYWACGPEAGLVFNATAAGDSPAPGFSHWTNSQPDAGGGLEAYLQFAYQNNDRWNDLNFQRGQNDVQGYYVEYGAYTNSTNTGASHDEELIPAPVYATYTKATDGSVLKAPDFYIGDIGTPYDATASLSGVTIPPGFAYSGTYADSAPTSGAFSAQMRTVKHRYANVYVNFFNNYGSSDTTRYAPGETANTNKSPGNVLDSFTAPARNGYSFTGWFNARSGGTRYTPGTSTFDVQGDLNLYAQWQEKNGYQVGYDLNGGKYNNSTTLSPQNGVSWSDTNLLPSGAAFSTALMSKAGYTFTGWKATANGSVTSYAGITINAREYSELVAPGTDPAYITLEAQWTVKSAAYQVNYDLDGGEYNGSTTLSSNPKSGVSWTDTNLLPSGAAFSAASMSRAGYSFAGWKATANGNGTVYASATANAMQYGELAAAGIDPVSVTLQAQWTAVEYAIGYELGDGTNYSGNPARYTTGELNKTAITLGNPTRSGYTFDGWTGGNGGTVNIESATQQLSFGGPAGAQDITGDMVFTAHWSVAPEVGSGSGNGGKLGNESGGSDAVDGARDDSGDGTSDGTRAPDTGDDANLALLVKAMAVSAALLLVLLVLGLKPASARRNKRAQGREQP